MAFADVLIREGTYLGACAGYVRCVTHDEIADPVG
jgi:hypothetical protein